MEHTHIDWAETARRVREFHDEMAAALPQSQDHQTAAVMLAEAADLEKDPDRPSFASFTAWATSRGLLIKRGE